MEIGEEAPLKVVAEAPLELLGERERMVWALAVGHRGCRGGGAGLFAVGNGVVGW